MTPGKVCQTLIFEIDVQAIRKSGTSDFLGPLAGSHPSIIATRLSRETSMKITLFNTLSGISTRLINQKTPSTNCWADTFNISGSVVMRPSHAF